MLCCGATKDQDAPPTPAFPFPSCCHAGGGKITQQLVRMRMRCPVPKLIYRCVESPLNSKAHVSLHDDAVIEKRGEKMTATAVELQ